MTNQEKFARIESLCGELEQATRKHHEQYSDDDLLNLIEAVIKEPRTCKHLVAQTPDLAIAAVTILLVNELRRRYEIAALEGGES